MLTDSTSVQLAWIPFLNHIKLDAFDQVNQLKSNRQAIEEMGYMVMMRTRRKSQNVFFGNLYT